MIERRLGWPVTEDEFDSVPSLISTIAAWRMQPAYQQTIPRLTSLESRLIIVKLPCIAKNRTRGGGDGFLGKGCWEDQDGGCGGTWKRPCDVAKARWAKVTPQSDVSSVLRLSILGPITSGGAPRSSADLSRWIPSGCWCSPIDHIRPIALTTWPHFPWHVRHKGDVATTSSLLCWQEGKLLGVASGFSASGMELGLQGSYIRFPQFPVHHSREACWPRRGQARCAPSPTVFGRPGVEGIGLNSRALIRSSSATVLGERLGEVHQRIRARRPMSRQEWRSFETWRKVSIPQQHWPQVTNRSRTFHTLSK